jgi:hypothetical protein
LTEMRGMMANMTPSSGGIESNIYGRVVPTPPQTEELAPPSFCPRPRTVATPPSAPAAKPPLSPEPAGDMLAHVQKQLESMQSELQQARGRISVLEQHSPVQEPIMQPERQVSIASPPPTARVPALTLVAPGAQWTAQHPCAQAIGTLPTVRGSTGMVHSKVAEPFNHTVCSSGPGAQGVVHSKVAEPFNHTVCSTGPGAQGVVHSKLAEPFNFNGALCGPGPGAQAAFPMTARCYATPMQVQRSHARMAS